MRKNRKLTVQLGSHEQEQLDQLLRGGVQPVRVIKRAQALRLLMEGQSPPQVAGSVGLSAEAVRAIGWRYRQGGLSQALYDRPRPGAKPRWEATEQHRVIAMVCARPPEGRARWTIRLIAEEAVKRKLVGQIGRETVRVLLQRHELKPWREKNVVRRGAEPSVPGQDGRRAGRLRATA